MGGVNGADRKHIQTVTLAQDQTGDSGTVRQKHDHNCVNIIYILFWGELPWIGLDFYVLWSLLANI